MITYIQSILDKQTIDDLYEVISKSQSWENLRAGQKPPYMLELCGGEKNWARDFVFHNISGINKLRLQQSAESCVGRKLPTFDTLYLNFFKYETGSSLGVHRDVRPPNEIPEGLDFASLVLYINDNYSGGEFFAYPHDSDVPTFQLKPLGGDAVIMNNNIRHESKQLISGNKYIAVMHWFDRDDL